MEQTPVAEVAEEHNHAETAPAQAEEGTAETTTLEDVAGEVGARSSG